MTSSRTGASGFGIGAFISCPVCEATVKFPAKYCDMCGGRLAQDVVLDFVRIVEQPARPQEDQPPKWVEPVAVRKDDLVQQAERRADQPPALDGLLSAQQDSRSPADTEAARRALQSGYLLLKGNEKSLESLEALPNAESFGSALWSRISSHLSMRPEIAELHRTLDLVVNEASKASSLDPEATIETDDGPLNALALLGRADHTRGNIEACAGKPRKAIHRYQSSIDKLKTQAAYFDMAVAYERIDQPGKALRAYETCGEISPDSEVGIGALENAEELRSQRVMGGWFLGSRNIVIVLGVCSLSGLVIMPIIPLAGLLTLGLWGGTLGVYCLAKFRLGGASVARGSLPR